MSVNDQPTATATPPPAGTATPETDAEFSRFCPENPKPFYHAMTALARRLELQRNQARAGESITLDGPVQIGAALSRSRNGISSR